MTPGDYQTVGGSVIKVLGQLPGAPVRRAEGYEARYCAVFVADGVPHYITLFGDGTPERTIDAEFKISNLMGLLNG